MNLTSSFEALSDGTLPVTFRGLKTHINIAWIEEALSKGGVSTIRRRKLPTEEVVWLVIGMSLYRDRPITDVVRRLDLVLPGKKGKPQRVSQGRLPPARDRVGVEPLRELFGITARRWARAAAEEDRWRGLMVLGADGTTLRVPDSPENRAEFHLPPSGRSTAGYPQIRLAALMTLRGRLWLDVDFADCRTGEGTLAWPLIQRVPDGSLTIVDRFYVDYAQLQALRSGGQERHWLVRAKKNLRWRVVQRLGVQDELVEIDVPPAARAKDPDGPRSFRVRAIRYRRKGFRPRVLLTSLLDPVAYPAGEIAALYHERWELELGFDELKTHALEREEAIRSRNTERVRQEVWGMAIAYNLVRREMEQFARERALPPRRISFRTSLMLIRDLFAWAADASPGSLPKMMRTLRSDMEHLILPPRRSERRYKRHVKIKMSGYPRNHGHPRSFVVGKMP